MKKISDMLVECNVCGSYAFVFCPKIKQVTPFLNCSDNKLFTCQYYKFGIYDEYCLYEEKEVGD